MDIFNSYSLRSNEVIVQLPLSIATQLKTRNLIVNKKALIDIPGTDEVKHSLVKFLHEHGKEIKHGPTSFTHSVRG